MMNGDTFQADRAGAEDQGRVKLKALELDEFERNLLPLLRHFFTSFETPERHSWRHAYTIAAERWGETFGLAVAYRLQKVVCAVCDARDVAFSFEDPLKLDARLFATQDEVILLRMLSHRRRDETPAARDAAAAIADGRIDPHVVRAGLAFANRFLCGKHSSKGDGRPAQLRVSCKGRKSRPRL